MNIYLVYEITNFYSIDSYPALTNALFGAVKLTKNADIDKYRYFGHGIGFDRHGFFSHPSGGNGKNVITFGADTSSFIHVDNKWKYFLVLGKGPTQGLGEHSLAAEKCIWLIFPKLTQHFVWACVIKEQTVTCLIMVQKFTNLKQMILKLYQIVCAWEMFQKIFQQETWKKLDLMVIFMTLVLIMMELMLIMF